MPDPQRKEPAHVDHPPDAPKAKDALLPAKKTREPSDAESAQQEQDRQLESGEENPGF